MATFAAVARGPIPPRTVETLYLQPGQLTVVTEPIQISTILGSCVSLCLWDGPAGIGGMNHFVLTEEDAPNTNSLRVAGPAYRQLVENLMAKGACKERLNAKLFGGASLLSKPWEGSIGQRNVLAGRRLLAEHAIPLVAQDVGGQFGRKLVFEATTGVAWVRLLGGGTP